MPEVHVHISIVRDLRSMDDVNALARHLGMMLEGGGVGVTTEIIGDPEPAQAAAASQAPAAAAPGRRGRKGANGAATAPAAPPAADPLADTSADTAADVSGPVDLEDEDSLGLPPASLTNEEAWEQALGSVRDIYAKGHRTEIKDLQKKLDVGKFTDIPKSDGHKLLAMVVAIQEKLGLRV